MRRIALCAGLIAALLSGCAQPDRITPRPLPDPLARTRAAPPHRVPAAPVPRIATPPPVREAPAVFDERELLPAGGIQRGLWNVIVVHHSANRGDTPASMDNYHRNVRKWSNGLGYHFVIGNGVNTEDGKVYVGSRWSRQLCGAHCKSRSGRYFGTWRQNNYFNAHGIGICLIGNFEHSRPTPRQLASLRSLTEFLCARARINPAHVYGHGEVTHRTACPGRFLSRELPQLRVAVAQALAVELDPGLPPGWPSGSDDQLPPPVHAYRDGAPLPAYAGVEGRGVVYR
jgi:hypothetical protein